MFNLKTLAVCAAMSAAGLLAVPGCGNKMMGDNTSMPDTTGMSKDDLMTKAQQMMSQGNSMQDKASSMQPGETQDGMTKDDMMSKAKALLQKGQALMEKAKSM